MAEGSAASLQDWLAQEANAARAPRCYFGRVHTSQIISHLRALRANSTFSFAS